MPNVFQQTSLTFDEAQSIVAESAAASADTDAKARAARSIRAAFRHWNNANQWDWLKTISSSLSVVAGTAYYALPYDVKSIYNVRTNTNNQTLLPVNRRIYDRTVYDPAVTGTPTYYDLFRKDALGYIEPLPLLATDSTETLTVRYYRRMVEPTSVSLTGASVGSGSSVITCSSVLGLTVGSAVTLPAPFAANSVVQAINSATTFTVGVSATAVGSNMSITIGGSSTLLDIPADFEDGILAWATHHFLANKAGERNAERTAYWKEYAAQLLADANKINNTNPDEELSFIPDFVGNPNVYNPNSIVYGMGLEW